MVECLFWEQEVVCSNHTIPTPDLLALVVTMYRWLYLVDSLNTLIFICSIVGLSCAVFALASTNMFYSVLWLVLVYFAAGFGLIFVGAEYVGLIFIIVYVGAIAILFLFVIMIFSFQELELRRFPLSLILFFVFVVLFVGDFFMSTGLFLGPMSSFFFFPFQVQADLQSLLIFRSDSIITLAIFFFNFYYFYVVASGLLLVVVLLGIVVILRQDVRHFYGHPSFLADYKVHPASGGGTRNIFLSY